MVGRVSTVFYQSVFGIFGSIAWCLIQLSVIKYARLNRRTKSILQETCCVKKHHSHKSYIDTLEPWGKKSHIKITINILGKKYISPKKNHNEYLKSSSYAARSYLLMPWQCNWSWYARHNHPVKKISTVPQSSVQFHKSQYKQRYVQNFQTKKNVSRHGPRGDGGVENYFQSFRCRWRRVNHLWGEPDGNAL